MRSDSQGIQQLLNAEKRADEKISQARKRKAARLKQAKEEAQSEIQKFREGKEKQFNDYELSFKGSYENDISQIEVETTDKLKEMDAIVVNNQASIIEQLLSRVLSVTPQLHENFRFGKSA